MLKNIVNTLFSLVFLLTIILYYSIIILKIRNKKQEGNKMTKIEMAIQSTEWKIEEAEKTIEEMRRNIKNVIDSDHVEFEVEFIMSYARRMNDAADRLKELRETKTMLEFVSKED